MARAAIADTRLLTLDSLIDYVAGGHTLEKFLDDFPSVPRELAVAALERLKK